MKSNMGSIDRIVRLIVAALIAILYLSGQISGITAVILLIVAVIFIITSFIKFCPLYFPFGISTCKPKRKEGTAKQVS